MSCRSNHVTGKHSRSAGQNSLRFAKEPAGCKSLGGVAVLTNYLCSECTVPSVTVFVGKDPSRCVTEVRYAT
jgi:hypothetical protein